jgi:hypothetical protein
VLPRLRHLRSKPGGMGFEPVPKTLVFNLFSRFSGKDSKSVLTTP